MFSYFIPNAAVDKYAGAPTLIGVNASMLDRMKLGYVGTAIAKQIQSGPSGNAGWLLYRDVPGAIDSYNPDSQVWQSMAYPSDYFIGYRKATGLPRPASLARETMLPGHPVRLGDGNQWNIPCAVEFDEDGNYGCRLPRTLKINGDGEWVLADVIPRYRSLWDTLSIWLNALVDAGGKGFHFAPANEWCVNALGVNYYVGPSEVSLLSLLNRETRSAIIEAIQDLETYFSILEKKNRVLATGDTLNGPSKSMPEPQPITDQPTPIG